MSKRIFTREQIETLLCNKNVAACSGKSITYQKDFKVEAVKHHQEGLPPSAIFAEAGFDISLIGPKTPKRCLRRWLTVYRLKGIAGLKNDGRTARTPRGRPKDPANLPEHEKLKYYEAQIAYLKAENAFLAKLRKQRLN